MHATRWTAIGRQWQTRLRTFFDRPAGDDATPLEICQAVLDQIEQRAQPVGGGRRVFPYAGLRVLLHADEETQAAMEVAFDTFADRVRERLDELRCESPGAVEVEVRCVGEPQASWREGQRFAIEWLPARRVAEAVLPPHMPALEVAVVAGQAEAEVYTFRQATVAIGRSADPTDVHGRVRRNRIAFRDVIDGVTETVGRAHARLRFDPETGQFRLFDEGSSNGTSIVRDGDVIVVHPRDPRGVRLQSGDEIQVGRAVLRVSIAASDQDT